MPPSIDSVVRDAWIALVSC